MKVALLMVLGINLVALGLGEADIIVQVSDIHISDYFESRAGRFGYPFGDLRLFSATVLQALQPAAVLITGDLVDGKSKTRRGQQSLTEWQSYRQAIEFIKADTGLPETRIFDTRGNHDTFNVPQRLGPEDYFPRFSAEGRRNETSRVFLHHLSSAKDQKCPSATLIGVDVSKDPGFSGTNFFGVADAALLAQLQMTLTEAKNNLRNRDCSPFFLAYGHFPLSIITHPETDPWGLFPRPQHQPIDGRRTLKQVLQAAGVSAYVNGHLHSAFGRKLHRMHKAEGGYLAELEASAWLSERRFRLLAVEEGLLTFTDLIFTTPEQPWQRGKQINFTSGAFGVSAVAKHQQVNRFIVMILSPPNARYSPLLRAEPWTNKSFHTVKAMVLPIHTEDQTPALKVTAKWSCGSINGAFPLQPVKSTQYLWQAEFPAILCNAKVFDIQVVTDDESASEIIPVAFHASGNGTAIPSEPNAPLSLDLSWFEWARLIALTLDWPHAGYWLMSGLWALHFVGLLILPRALLALRQRSSAPKPHPPSSLAAAALRMISAPVNALVDMASLPDIWWPQVALSIYLGFGPWAVVKILGGEPSALVLCGRILYSLRGQWHLLRSVDTSIYVVVNLIAGYIPLTCLVASMSQRLLQNGRGAQRLFFNTYHILFLAFVVLLQFRFTVYYQLHGFGIAGDAYQSGRWVLFGFYGLLLGRLYLYHQQPTCCNPDRHYRDSSSDSLKSE